MAVNDLRQFFPLEINNESGEPFIRLPSPHSNIIITPPRMTDSQAILLILNDPRVYRYLIGPPLPYKIEHAEEWLSTCVQSSNNILEELRRSTGTNDIRGLNSHATVSGCPVRSLREEGPNGTDIYLGDIGIRRCIYYEIKNAEQRERMIKENEDLKTGDKNIIWEIGDYISTDYQGKGIMTAALKAIMEKWAIPRMNVRQIRVTTFEENKGSVRVFEKNGFNFIETVKDCLELPESKGGGRIGLHVLEWAI